MALYKPIMSTIYDSRNTSSGAICIKIATLVKNICLVSVQHQKVSFLVPYL